MKKIIILLLFLCPHFLGAVTLDHWEIKIDEPVLVPQFIKDEEVETYTGEMATVHLEHQPAEGNVFLLLPISVQRKVKNQSSFQAQHIRLSYQGQVYERVQNDAFLIDYDILPFTHLLVNLEKQKGTLLFEIPKPTKTSQPAVLLFKTTVLKQLSITK